jgi:hypothetical protein
MQIQIRSLWSGLALSLLVSPVLAAAGGPYMVTFVIDMREEIAAKRFDPATDGVGVRSGVAPLTWDETLPARDADGDGRYEVKVSFPDRPFGGQPVTYKFKVDSPRAAGLNAGWEDGKNRLLLLNEAIQTVTRRFNDPGPPIQPVRTGTIRTHPGFTSKFLGPRDVIVYLPPGYDKEPSRRYPVLYMHDGQNLFDASAAGMEWQMDETAEKLIRSGQIEPVIIIGVSSTEARPDEYTHTTMEWKQPDGSVLKGGGKAGLYGRLLIETPSSWRPSRLCSRRLRSASGSTWAPTKESRASRGPAASTRPSRPRGGSPAWTSATSSRKAPATTRSPGPRGWKGCCGFCMGRSRGRGEPNVLRPTPRAT